MYNLGSFLCPIISAVRLLPVILLVARKNKRKFQRVLRVKSQARARDGCEILQREITLRKWGEMKFIGNPTT